VEGKGVLFSSPPPPRAGQYLTNLPGVDDVLRNWSVVGINTGRPRYVHGLGRVTYDERPFRWIGHI